MVCETPGHHPGEPTFSADAAYNARLVFVHLQARFGAEEALRLAQATAKALTELLDGEWRRKRRLP